MQKYSITITVELNEGKTLRNLADELKNLRLKSGIIQTSTATSLDEPIPTPTPKIKKV